jgi:flagellar hook protein FlgE
MGEVMGVYSALTTAVSGLRAQSYAIENISGNIANSRTTGFKRIDTQFIDLIPDSPANRELAGSVIAASKATTSVQGDTTTTSISTNMAINGDGFFIVAKSDGGTGTNINFQGTSNYTRRGDFDFDSNGYLVNGSGYYLKGLQYDLVTGAPIGTQEQVIKVNNNQLPPVKTSEINYGATLPPIPEVRNHDPLIANSELMKPVGTYTVNPYGAAGVVVAADETNFNNQTLAGGSVVAYNPLGQGVNLQLRWGKTANNATAGVDRWNLFVLENPVATGAVPRWRNAGQDFEFNAAGQMTLPATGIVALPTITDINGTVISGVNLNVGSGSLTQYQTQGAATNGQIQANAINQNGYASGVLERTSVDKGGRLVGSYSNGQIKTIAQLSYARFQSPNNLKRVDGGAFEQTLESGLPLIGTSTGALIGGAIESSNVDIADEFSKMIVTQQAYSANTKVITTAQDMLREAINIIR